MSTLDQLNSLERDKTFGGVIFVSILMVTGIVGNIHVLFVYIFKTNESSRKTFIVVLGTLDFIASSFGMPLIVFDLTNPLTFDFPVGCKILRFVNYFVSVSSMFILTVIAVDRYRKVCKPLTWQISRTMAKCLCLGVICLSGSISWPAAVLYGSQTKGTSNPNVTGVSCLIKEQFENTNYPLMFNSLLLLVVFGASACLIVLYAMIARTVALFRQPTVRINNEDSTESPQRMRKHFGKSNLRSYKEDNCVSSNGVTSTSTVTDEGESDNDMNMSIFHVSVTSSINDLHRKQNDVIKGRSGKYSIGNEKPARNPSSKRQFLQAHKTTVMFCLITLVFILSYFPHLILKLISLMNASFFNSMSPTGLVFYNTFIWCFYINNVANAIIYYCFEKKFRHEIGALYGQFICRCRNKQSDTTS